MRALRFISILSISLLISCINHNVNYNLEFLGLEDKYGNRLVLEEPYLYVCACAKGLWRQNIRNMNDWEYLGLADTTLGNYINVGVLDVDVKDQDILVAYNGAVPDIPPENTVGIWRSTDGGQNWFPSDSGIPESITDPFEYNIINSLQRSLHNPEIAVCVVGPAIYRSNDNGYNWNLIAGNRGVAIGRDYVRWNPYQPGEVWFFGETSIFSPYLKAAQDYGLEWKVDVNFNELSFPSDGAVTDIAFDAGSPNIIYAATSKGLIKSTDGGYNWQVCVFNLHTSIFVSCVHEVPRNPNALFLAGRKHIYYSSNGGKNIDLIGELEKGFIYSLELDSDENQLFVGTNQGIYVLQIMNINLFLK